jgi:hypothetical protein
MVRVKIGPVSRFLEQVKRSISFLNGGFFDRQYVVTLAAPFPSAVYEKYRKKGISKQALYCQI